MTACNESKVFIIGLPRTATTSVCVEMLAFGFKTAHTAYTHKCFEQAQVIADTPIFCDYQTLDLKYPNAKFINLSRDLTLWVPSIRQLLSRMFTNLHRQDGGFNPIIKRCFLNVFSPLTEENIASDEFLISCYERHQAGIQSYFSGREHDLITINVAQSDSYNELESFLRLNFPTVMGGEKTACDTNDTNGKSVLSGFKPINIGGKVTAWNKIKHPLKVASTNNGKVDRL